MAGYCLDGSETSAVIKAGECLDQLTVTFARKLCGSSSLSTD